jgi:hypothetical protein
MEPIRLIAAGKIPRNASLILCRSPEQLGFATLNLNGRERFARQNSICTHRGKSAFQKPPPIT